MKKSVIWMIGFLLLVLPGTALSDGWSGNINALVGMKTMDSDWDPVDQQAEGGIMLDLKYGDGPWSFVTYMTYSSDSGDNMPATVNLGILDDRFVTAFIADLLDVDADTQELCVGLTYTWNLNFIKLYAGGGLGAIRAHLKGTGAIAGTGETNEWDLSNPANPFRIPADYSIDYTLQDSDVGVGPWVSGGAYVVLVDHITVGFDVRGIMADVKLFEGSVAEPVEMKAGGFHYSIFAGYHW